MAKIYLADTGDYVVAQNFDSATEVFIETRGKDPVSLSLFKDEELVIESSPVRTVTTKVLPEGADTDGATASPAVSYVKEGDSITLTATPSVGYPTFVEWQDSTGTQVSTDNPFNYTAITENVELSAVFSV